MNITRLSRAVIRHLGPAVSFRIAANSPTLVKLIKNEEFSSTRRNFSVFSKSPDYSEAPLVDLVTFEASCNETIEALTDYFEELVEADSKFANADVAYSVRESLCAGCPCNYSYLYHQDGVLTVKLEQHGTYVINRQTPNRQIWLSSPTSGPKRYDLVDGNWIYKHDGVSLHELLQTELSKIIATDVDFLKLASNKK